MPEIVTHRPRAPLSVLLLEEGGPDVPVIVVRGTIGDELAARTIWGSARYVGIDRHPEYESWCAGTDRRIGAEESALARAVRRGESSIGELFDIEPFDGPRKTISNSAVPIRDAAGAIA